ncbi:MAG: protein kinase domain-containing protein [Mycobacteriales bacterium]
MAEWDVPGYDVLELLGFGASGEVWRARERSGGAPVALRRLAGGDRAAVAAVRRQATVVRSLPSPHLVRLRTTTRAGRDDVLVVDHAAGGSLAALLQRRGTLAPGEVVTAVAPLAEALGQAHAHGLVHGRLRASEVLLTADGRPLLDGLGTAALHDPEDGHDPTGALGASADVWALGALAHQLLTGEQPGPTVLGALAPRAPLPLVRAVESALAFDPTTRPSAADLAAALLAACPALPLQGVVAAALPEPVRRRLPRPHVRRPEGVARRVLAGAAVGLALLSVAAVGRLWGHRAVEAPARVAAAGPDWARVVAGLERAREEAFAGADAGRLLDVYAPASPLLSSDQLAVAALGRAGRTADGVEHEVRGLTPLRVGADRAELSVVEVLGAVAVRDARGRVVSSAPAGPDRTVRMVLTRTPQGWRVLQVA